MLESRRKIDIPLKQIPTSQRGPIAALARNCCENEYATRYLEDIGVQATKDQRDIVLSNLPMEKALVIPVWTSGSLVIVPERREEKDPNTIKQLYTGSKELDTSKKSKIENFYGKGVSAPGTKPLPHVSKTKTYASGTMRDLSPIDDTEEEIQSPSIHVTFPVEGYMPGQEAGSKLFKKMLKPLAVSDVRLKMAVKSFSMTLSNFIPQIFDDPTGQLNVAIQNFIATPICRRLYGLLCHHVFWNLVHPFAHKVLVACRKQFPMMMYAQASTQSASLGIGSKASIYKSRADSIHMLSSPTFHYSEDGDVTDITREKIRHFDSTTTDGGSLDEHDIPHGGRKSHPSRSESYDDHEHEHDHGHDFFSQDIQSVGDSAHYSNSMCQPSVTSTTSLSSEEKEMLYIQLEDCISQMHSVMGYQQNALRCCRQTLVSACHYIAHDIICTHYGWLDEKRDVSPSKTKEKSSKHKNGTNDAKTKNHHYNLPPLNVTDRKNIQALRKGVLKSISVSLTELLDPARVFASRISKEMFDGEDITLREVTPKAKNDVSISHGQLSRVRESKDAHRKGKFTSTSLAIQAIFSSSSCSAETRKFLLASAGQRPQALSRLGTGKRHSHTADSPSVGDSSQGSHASRGSNGSFDTSLEFSLAGAHKTEKNIRNDISMTKDDHSTTISEFKTMLAEKGIDPLKRSKLGLTHIAVEPEPSFLSELNILNKSPVKGLGRGKNTISAKSLVGEGARPTYTSRPNSVRQKKEADELLSTDARAKLMTLVVGRSKSKYKDKTILQNSSHPNAKYRKDLLSTGGNSSRLL